MIKKIIIFILLVGFVNASEYWMVGYDNFDTKNFSIGESDVLDFSFDGLSHQLQFLSYKNLSSHGTGYLTTEKEPEMILVAFKYGKYSFLEMNDTVGQNLSLEENITINLKVLHLDGSKVKVNFMREVYPDKEIEVSKKKFYHHPIFVFFISGMFIIILSYLLSINLK